MGWLGRLFGRGAGGPGSATAARDLLATPVRGVGPVRTTESRRPQHHVEFVDSGVSGGYAVVDVETTGLSPRRDRIVSVGVVLLDPRGHIQDEWTTLVNPRGPVGATHIHGIRDSDVIDSPCFDELIEPIVQLFRGRVLAGHNVSFDIGFLKYEFGRAGWGWPSVPTLCTMQESVHFLPHLDRRRLADCCWAAGIPLEHAHSALHDARATAHLLGHYLDPYCGVAPLPTHRAVISLASDTVWPNCPGTGRAFRPEAPRRDLSERAQHVLSNRPPPLGSLLARFTLSDAVDDGATPGSLSYLETLVEVLEDGHVSAQERATLADVAELYELASGDIALAHRGLVRALAREALEDGHLARAEKSEVSHIATLLSVPDRAVRDFLNGEEEARLVALSANLCDLPDDWTLGQPIRVGDRIAFTGCDNEQRDDLERCATERGVRVLGNVSRRTALLVTDGSYNGNKAQAAAELGTRVVHPDDFRIMLDFIQPWAGSVATACRTQSPATSMPALVTAGSAKSGANDQASTGSRRDSPSTVRAWALEAGFEVGTRGRLSAEIWEAYAVAHRGTTL